MKSLLFLFLIAACSKEVKEVHHYIPAQEEASQSQLVLEPEIERLLSQEKPNLAFSLFIAKAIGKAEKQTEISSLINELSKNEINEILTETKKTNEEIRRLFLFKSRNYQNNHQLIRASVSTKYSSNFNFNEYLTYNTFAYLKSKSLNDIIKTYEEQTNRLLQDLIPVVASELLSSQPQKVQEIEELVKQEDAEKAIKVIHQSIENLKNVSRILGESNLSSKDKIVLGGTGVLAGAIYSQIKDKKEFKKIVSTVKDIQEKYKDFQKKYKEFMTLAGSLSENLDRMNSGLKDFSSEMKEAGKGLSSLTSMATRSAEGSSGVHSKRIVDFVNSQIRGGKKVSPDNISDKYKLQAQQITQSISKGFEAAHNATQGLDNILRATTRMTELLGVKLPTSVQKSIQTAQKVISVVSLGKSIMDAYTTGGVMTALNVMGGSSPFGGDPNTARYAQIDKKLNQILENQRLMIQTQIEMMNMIKELAIMIDKYHEREMAALAELRDYSLIQLEIQKSNLVNNDIKSCEQIINYQLSSVWSQHNFYKDPYYSIGHIQLLEKKIFERINGLQGVRQMIFSAGQDNLKECHRAFGRAFGSRLDNENPLLAIYETNESNNLLRFKRNIYQPSYELLKMQAGSDFVPEAPLHLPLETFDMAPTKHLYLTSTSSSSEAIRGYELDSLISVKNLERYVSSLLLIYPLLEVREDFWEKDLESIVTEFIDNTGVNTLYKNRGTFLLQNALQLTQSAIAQEAILAGEPMLVGIEKNLHRDLLSKTQCGTTSAYTEGSTGADFICALRTNPLLMKNYINFYLNSLHQQGPDFIFEYEKAIEKQDTAYLKKILQADVDIVTRTRDDKTYLAIKLSGLRSNESNDVYVYLPEPNEVEKGQIQFSENLQRLMAIQESLLEHLEKTYPIQRDIDQKTLGLILMNQ